MNITASQIVAAKQAALAASTKQASGIVNAIGSLTNKAVVGAGEAAHYVKNMPGATARAYQDGYSGRAAARDAAAAALPGRINSHVTDLSATDSPIRSAVHGFAPHMGLRQGALWGGLAGAALGAINPGTDEDGEERGRLSGALRGVLPGAMLGGAAGYGVRKLVNEPLHAAHGTAAMARIHAEDQAAAAPAAPGLSAGGPAVPPSRSGPAVRVPDASRMKSPGRTENDSGMVSTASVKVAHIALVGMLRRSL